MVPAADAEHSPDTSRTDPTHGLGAAGRRVAVAAGVGFAYAVVVLTWALDRGMRFTAEAPADLLAGVAYGGGGMVLVAGVPAYLLARYSLVVPWLVTTYTTAQLLYQTYYGSHLHPVSSHFVVWPLFLALVVAGAVLEAGARTVARRTVDRFGTRPLL